MAAAHNLRSVIGPGTEARATPVLEAFRAQGFDTILSVGEYEENRIGSNCGMYLGALDGNGDRRPGGGPARI